MNRLKRRLRSHLAIPGASLMLTVGLNGCSSDATLGRERASSCELAEPQGEVQEIELTTFWTKPPDDVALNVLKVRLTNLDIDFTPSFRTGRTDLQLSLLAASEGERFADVYQVNGGSDVLRFAQSQEESPICPLNRLFDLFSVKENYFEAAWRPSQCQGSYFAIPLNIHRINTVMLNTELYAQLQLQSESQGETLPDYNELKDADELLDVLETAHRLSFKNAEDERVVPLALCLGASPDTNWPLQHIAFEAFLSSYPNSAYESIWQGSDETVPNLRQEASLRLAAHVSRLGLVSNLGPDYDFTCGAGAELEADSSLSWQRAPELVIGNQALLTIGGDWIRGGHDESAEAHVETVPFPGSDNTFVYTPDSFAVPRKLDDDGSSAHSWLKNVVDHKETQLAFSAVKQAIPARSDLNEQDLDALGSDYLKDGYLRFKSCHQEDSECRLLLAVSGLGPAAGHNPCFERIGMVLARIAGVEYPDADWPLGCDLPIPHSVEDAQELLVTLLQRSAEDPYAPTCRGGD